MAARLSMLLPRVALVMAIGFLSAAQPSAAAAQRPSASPARGPALARPTILVVPDVRRQAYVFAKGSLGDAGFAWRVAGSVQGYPGNLVAGQQPAPGTRVVDTGAPTVVLQLRRNGAYGERGTPENYSPYPGSAIRLADLASSAPAAAPQAATPPRPAAAPRPAASYPRTRPPAFRSPGAPKEPLDEMPLPNRARLLLTWLSSHPRPTGANVGRWLYQHAWIVDGAQFGWWRGAEALRLLVGADHRVEALWGIGYKSEALVRAALARVEARAVR